MKYLLPNNRGAFNSAYNAGLSSSIYIPLNSGRYVGPDNNSSLFKTKPDNNSVNLADWITAQIGLGNITDNNGIISALPLGNVTVNGSTNDLVINAGSFEVITPLITGLRVSETETGYAKFEVGDYYLNGFGLQITLDDEIGIITLGDVGEWGGGTRVIVNDDAGTVTLTTNINFPQKLVVDGSGVSIQVDGGNYYLPPFQPTALTHDYIATWVAGTPQWKRLGIGAGFNSDATAGAGGVAIGQIYYNTVTGAFHTRLT